MKAGKENWASTQSSNTLPELLQYFISIWLSESESC